MKTKIENAGFEKMVDEAQDLEKQIGDALGQDKTALANRLAVIAARANLLAAQINEHAETSDYELRLALVTAATHTAGIARDAQAGVGESLRRNARELTDSLREAVAHLRGDAPPERS